MDRSRGRAVRGFRSRERSRHGRFVHGQDRDIGQRFGQFRVREIVPVFGRRRTYDGDGFRRNDHFRRSTFRDTRSSGSRIRHRVLRVHSAYVRVPVVRHGIDIGRGRLARYDGV